jgi:hypothetical protein
VLNTEASDFDKSMLRSGILLSSASEVCLCEIFGISGGCGRRCNKKSSWHGRQYFLVRIWLKEVSCTRRTQFEQKPLLQAQHIRFLSNAPNFFPQAKQNFDFVLRNSQGVDAGLLIFSTKMKAWKYFSDLLSSAGSYRIAALGSAGGFAALLIGYPLWKCSF